VARSVDVEVEVEDSMLVEPRVLVPVGFGDVVDRDPAAAAAEERRQFGIAICRMIRCRGC
jgi:hypothetical protein